MTTPLRDYTKIENKNCQLVTHYRGKNFGLPQDIAVGPNDEVFIVDRFHKEVIIFDKDLKLIRTFGQGSGDSKLNDPKGVAVGHNVIAVGDWNDVIKYFSLQGDYLSKSLALLAAGMANFFIILKDCVLIAKVYSMSWIVLTAEFRCSERMCSYLNLALKDIVQDSLGIHVLLL